MVLSPLVSTQWLADKIASPDLVVVNAWLPPVGQPDVPPEYPQGHIPGAVFFDVNAIADTTSDLPHMLPPAHVFSSMMRRMGIGDGQTIVEQIRDLQAALSVTGHHGARRVVVLDPAEAMNPFTANALLKLLEEPPAGCVFLLVSSAPRRLLPTIRSRCQQWLFARPEEHALAHWKTRADSDVLALLALGGGMPLAAERLARAGGGALLARFVRDLAGLQASDALKLAAQWESWLKSREALAAGFGLPELCDWMQRWVSDLASVRLGGRVRFFPAQQAVLSTLASRCSVAAASACYNEMAQIRRVSRHPLSLRLVLEDLLMRYVRATAGVRG